MPDYHQFYLWDSSDRDAPVDFAEKTIEQRMHIGPGVVVVSPIRNMPVPVEITIWDSEPQVVFNLWQHIVEAPLLLERDRLEVHECCGETKAQFTIPAGWYVVRALMRNLDKLSEDGLSGEDYYEVQIWPGRIESVRLLRQWP